MDIVEAYSSNPFYSQLEQMPVTDWEFLEDFPDAAAFARASLEVDKLLKPLQTEQEECGRRVTEARTRLSTFKAGLDEVQKHVIDTSAKDVLNDITKAAQTELEESLTKELVRLNLIQSKLAVFYDVTSKMRRAADPNACGECPVCMHARVTLVLIPCGHCICATCYRDRPVCHYCCTPVDRSLRIYL